MSIVQFDIAYVTEIPNGFYDNDVLLRQVLSILEEKEEVDIAKIADAYMNNEEAWVMVEELAGACLLGDLYGNGKQYLAVSNEVMVHCENTVTVDTSSLNQDHMRIADKIGKLFENPASIRVVKTTF